MDLSRQVITYAGIGFLQWLLDSTVMVAASHAGIAVALATLAGRLSGAALGYWLNGRYTFLASSHSTLNRTSLRRFISFWLLATLLSALALAMIDRHYGLLASWLYKPAVDVALAMLGFVASRYWIYPVTNTSLCPGSSPGDGPQAG